MGRVRVGIAWGLTVLVAAAIGVVAGRQTLRDPGRQVARPRVVTYTVRAGQVESVLRFSASASWPVTSSVGNQATGIVTSVAVKPGATVHEGSVLYSVDLRPTVAAVGAVPSFRSLSEGDVGADVTQLERLLAAGGFYSEPIGSDFDYDVKVAVERWQEKLGVKDDGVVQSGDIVYMPRLPARIALKGLARGSQAGPGSGSVEILGATPAFQINLGQGEQNLVPLSAAVTVGNAPHQWRAHISSSITTATGDLILHLSGASGGAVCGSACSSVPFDSHALYPAQIVAVPLTSGPKVPVSAIQTAPSGSAYVVTGRGEQVPVTVRASFAGEAIVSGIGAGTRVRLFGAPGA